MLFDWDDSKAESNRKKHGVSFAEATTAFRDSNAIEFLDQDCTLSEDRWLLLGLSSKNRILMVVYVEKAEEIIRVISARKAVKEEVNEYFSRINR